VKIYLIQGFFFQDHQWLKLGYDHSGEMSVFVQEGLGRFMFSGVMYPDENSVMGDLAGQMVDQIGDSMLTEGRILPDQVKFVKSYLRIPGEIRYEFEKQGDIWIGRYSGERSGEGGATCIITEVTEEIFRPPADPKQG